MKYFGTSGIRQLYSESLVFLALQVGFAAGNNYSRIVLGRDTRTSGDVMNHALIAGMLAGGARCYDAGIVPTPTLAYATRNADAGVMITASHNPPPYNGIKPVNPDGSAFTAEQRRKIEQLIAEEQYSAAAWDVLQSVTRYETAIEEHIERIIRDFSEPVKARVVLDCGCGAGSVITPYLLRRMGCEVLCLNTHPSGFYAHPVEPIPENLGELMMAVKEFGADVGIAHDGDADRMMAVDDQGRFIPGDILLAMLAKSVNAGTVVTTVDASMSIDELGFTVKRTKVGDPYVSEELLSGGEFGAEPSGSWVFPGVSYCPDGIYAAAQMAFMASQQRLSKLADEIPLYPVKRGSHSSEGVVMEDLLKRLEAMAPSEIDETDGTKLIFPDGWLLVRASGTEPKIRITVEAKNDRRLNELYESGIAAIRDSVR